MRHFLSLTKALADETRLRILLALHDQELCVCQLIVFLNLAPSTVSAHLSLMKKAGLLEKRKSGKWAYYRLAGKEASPEIKTAISWVWKSLCDDKKNVADRGRLKKILAKNRDEICFEAKSRMG